MPPLAARFARLEQRANAAVIANLSNRIVSAAGIASFEAIYDDTGAGLAEGMATGYQPRLSAVPLVVADVLLDRVVTLTNPADATVTAFTVTGLEHEGAGTATLVLQRA